VSEDFSLGRGTTALCDFL